MSHHTIPEIAVTSDSNNEWNSNHAIFESLTDVEDLEPNEFKVKSKLKVKLNQDDGGISDMEDLEISDSEIENNNIKEVSLKNYRLEASTSKGHTTNEFFSQTFDLKDYLKTTINNDGTTDAENFTTDEEPMEEEYPDAIINDYQSDFINISTNIKSAISRPLKAAVTDFESMNSESEEEIKQIMTRPKIKHLSKMKKSQSLTLSVNRQLVDGDDNDESDEEILQINVAPRKKPVSHNKLTVNNITDSEDLDDIIDTNKESGSSNTDTESLENEAEQNNKIDDIVLPAPIRTLVLLHENKSLLPTTKILPLDDDTQTLYNNIEESATDYEDFDDKDLLSVELMQQRVPSPCFFFESDTVVYEDQQKVNTEKKFLPIKKHKKGAALTDIEDLAETTDEDNQTNDIMYLKGGSYYQDEDWDIAKKPDDIPTQETIQQAPAKYVTYESVLLHSSSPPRSYKQIDDLLDKMLVDVEEQEKLFGLDLDLLDSGDNSFVNTLELVPETDALIEIPVRKSNVYQSYQEIHIDDKDDSTKLLLASMESLNDDQDDGYGPIEYNPLTHVYQTLDNTNNDSDIWYEGTYRNLSIVPEEDEDETVSLLSHNSFSASSPSSSYYQYFKFMDNKNMDTSTDSTDTDSSQSSDPDDDSSKYQSTIKAEVKLLVKTNESGNEAIEVKSVREFLTDSKCRLSPQKDFESKPSFLLQQMFILNPDSETIVLDTKKDFPLDFKASLSDDHNIQNLDLDQSIPFVPFYHHIQNTHTNPFSDTIPNPFFNSESLSSEAYCNWLDNDKSGGFSSSNEEKILDKPLGQQLLGLSTIDDSVDTDLKTILDQTNAFIQFESQPEPHNPITEKYTNIEKPNAKKTTDHKNNTNEKKKAKKGFFGSIKTFVERSFESDSDSEKSPKKQKKQKKEKKHKEAIETAPSPICKPKLPTPPLAPSDIDSIPFADTPPTYKPPAVPPENRDKSPKKKIKSKTVHLEEVTKTIEPYVIEAEEFSIVVDPTKKESPKKSKETFTINIDESIDKIEKQILEKSPILTEEKIMKPTAALEKDSRRLTKPLDEINAPIDNINMSFNDVKSYTTDLIQNEINFNPWFYEYQATSIKKEESKIEDKQDKEVFKEPKKKKREEKSGFFGLFKKKEPKKDEDLLVSERITADFDEKQKKIDDCKGFLSTEVQHYEDAKPMHKLTDEQAIYQNGSTATEEAPPDKKIFSNILESTVEVQSKPVLQGILKKRDVDEDKQKYEKNLATTHEFLSSEVHNYEDGEVIRKETSSAKPSKRKEEIDCQQVPTTLEDLKKDSQKTVIESVPASVQEIKSPELKLHTDLKLETNIQTENVIKEVEASLKADSFKCKSNKEETFVSGAIDSKVLAQEFLSTEIIYYEDGKLLAKEELSNVVHVIDKTDNQNGEAPAESSRGGFLNIFKMTKKEEVIESDEQDKQNVPQFVSPKLLKETTAKLSEAKKEIVESVHESPKKKDVGIFKIFKAKTSEKEIKTDIENSNLIEKQKNDCHAFLSTELQLYEDGKLLTEDLPAKQIEPILLETSKKIMVDSKASPKPKHGGIFKILKKTKSEDKSLEEAEHKTIIPETNKFISTEQTYYEDNKVNKKEEINALSQVVHPQKIAETKLEKTRDAATEKSVDNLEASSKSKPGGIFKIFKKPKTEDEKLADTTKDNEQAQAVSHTFLSTEKHLYEDGIRSKPEEIPAPSIDTSEKVVPKTKSKEIKDDITKKIIDNIEASPKTKRGGIFKMFKKSKTGKEASEDDIKESDPTKHLTETDKFLSTEVELYEDGKLATAKDTTASINILEVTQQSEKDPKENVDVLKSKDIIIIKGSLEKTVEESPLQAHKLAADVFLSTEKELYEDGLLAQSEYERKSKHAQEEIAEILTQPIDASFKSKQDDTKTSKKAEVEPHQTISGVETFLSTEIKLYEDSKLTKDDQQSILITAEKPKTISEEITEKIVQNVEESPKSKRGGVFKIFKKSKTEDEVKDKQELQKHIDDSHKFLSTELELYEDGKLNQEKEKIASDQEVESKHIIIKEATSEEIVEKEVEKSLKKTESSSKPKQGGILKVFKKTKKDENVEKDLTDIDIEKIINASRGFISKELEFYEDARLQKETFVIPTKISKSQDLIEESKSKQIKEEIDKLNETLETSSKPEQSGMLKVFKKSKDQQNKKDSELKECQKNIKLSGEFLSTELNLYDDGKTETEKKIVGGMKIKQVPEVLKKITDNLKSTDVVQIFKPQKDKYEETQNQESKEIKEESVEKAMQDVKSSPKSSRGLFGIFKKPKKEENKNLLKQDSIDNKQSGPTNEKQKEITKEFLSTELELYEDSQPAKSNQNVLLLKEEKAKQPREINEQLTEKILQDVEASPKSTRGGLFGIFKNPKTEKSDFQKRESKEIQESQIASDHLQEKKNSQEFLSTEINLYEDSKPTILKVNLDQLKDEEKADKGKSKEIKEDIIEQTAQDVETLPKSTRGGLFGLFKKSKIEESEVLQKQVSKDIQESKIEDDLQKEITNSEKFLCTEVKLYEDSTRMASKQVTCQLKDEGKAEKRISKEVKEEIIKHVTQDVESSPKTTRSGLFGLINKPKIKENEVFQKQNSKDIEQSEVTELQTEAKYSKEFLSTKDKLLEDSKQNIPKKDVCQLQDDVKADKRKSKEDKGEIIEPIVLDVESSPKTSRGGLFGIFKKPKIGGSEVLQKQNSKEIQQSKIESDLQKEIPNSHEFLSTEIKLYEDSKPIITPDNICDIQDEEKAEKRKSSEIKEEILEKTAQDVEASPKSSRGLFEIFKKSKKEDKELEHQTFTKAKDEQNELLNQINDSQQFLTTELKLYEDSKPVKSKEELSHSKELKRKSKEIKEEIVKSETQELGEPPKTKRGGVFNIFKKSKTSVEEQEGEDLKKCKTDTQAFLSTEVEHYEDAKEIPTFVDTQNLTKSVESFPENDICTKSIGDQKQKAQDELNEGSEKTKNDIVNVKQFVTTEVEKYEDSEKFQREEIKPERVKALSTAPAEDHGGLFTTIFKKSKKDVESQNIQQENDEIAKDVKITCKEVKNASEVEGSPKTARGSIFNLFQKKPKKSEEHDDNEKAIKESQQAAIDTRDFLIKEKENYNDGDYKKEVKQTDLEIVSQNIPVESSPRTSRVGVFNIFKKSRKSEERDELVSSDKTVLNEKDKPIDDIIISRQILFGVFKRSKKSEDKPTDFPAGSSRDSEEYILPEEVKKLIHLTDDFISVEIENYESGKHSFQQACSNENIKSDTARFLLDEVTNYYDSFGFKPEISEDIVEDNKFDNKCLVEEPPKVGFLAKFKKTKKKPSLEDTQIDNPILEPDIEKHEIEEEIKKEKPSKDKKSFFNIFGKKAKSQDSTESRGRTDEVETSPKKQKIRKSSSPFKFFEKSRKSEEETPKEMLEASETVIKEFQSNVETQDRSSMSLTEELLENLEQKMKELKKDLSPETEKRISDCRDFLFIEKDNYEDSEPVVTDIDDEDVLKQVDSIIETAARAVEVKQGLLLETQTDNEDSISASQSAGGVNLVSKLGQLGDQVQTQKEAAATKLNLFQKESTGDGTKKLKIVEFAKDGISAEKVTLDTDKTQVLQCLRGNIEELDAKTAKVKDSTQTVLEAHFKALHQNKDELSKAMQEESEKIDKTLKKMHETSEHTVERTAKASEDIFKEAKNVQTEVTVKGSELRQTSKDKINLQRDQSSTDFVQNAVIINLDDIQKTLSKETDGAKQKIQEEIKNVDDLSKDVITKVRDVRAGVKENWQDFQKDTKTKLETEKETVKDDTTKLLQLAESEFDHLASTTGDIKDVVEKKATAGFESFCKTLSNQEDQLKETVVELSDNIGKKNRTLEAHLNEEQDKLQDAFQKTENVLKTEVQSKTDGLGETIEALQSEVRKKADNVQETFKLQKNKTIEVLQCAKKDLEDIKSFTKQTVTTDLDNLQKKLSKETTKQVFTKEMVTTDLDNLQKELSKETTKQTRIEVDDLQAQFKKELEEIEQIIKQQKADASATSQYEHEVVADQSKSVSDKFESNGIFQTDKTIKSLTEEKETILKDVDTNKEKLTENLTHVKENPSQYLRKIGELPKSVTANITQNVDNFQQTISAEYNKSYVTSPTMARRAVSQRLSQEDRPVVREVRYIEPDEENIEAMYSVTEPEEDDATKKKPLFHLESEEDDSFESSRLKDRRESTNSNILETLSENKIDNLLSTLELQLVKDLEESASVVKITGSDTILEEETRKLETLKKESETDVEQIEQKLRDLDKALDSLEKESDPKLEKKLHRVERKFERMASEVLETDPVEVSPSEFQKLVSQLSTEEVSDFQKEYSHLWDETTFSKSDEWDSKTPDSQVDVQELPQETTTVSALTEELKPIPLPKPRQQPKLEKQISPVRDDLLDSDDIAALETYSDKKKFWESMTSSKKSSPEEKLETPVPKPKPRSVASITQEAPPEKIMTEYQASFKPPEEQKPKSPPSDSLSDSDSEKAQESNEIAGYISDSGDVEQYISDSEIEDRVPQIRERQMSVFAPPVAAARKTIYERSASLPTEDMYEVSARSIKLRKQYYEEQIKKEMIEEQLTSEIEEEPSPERKTLIASLEDKVTTVRDIARSFDEAIRKDFKEVSFAEEDEIQETPKRLSIGSELSDSVTRNGSTSKPDSMEVHVDKSEIEDSEKLADLDQDTTDIETKSLDSLNAVEMSPKFIIDDGIPEITVTTSGIQRRISEESDEYAPKKQNLDSPINVPEEHVEDTVWEVSIETQPYEKAATFNTAAVEKIEKDDDFSASTREESDLGSEIHQDHSDSCASDKIKSDSHSDIERIILDSLHQQKMDPEEAKLIASQLIGEIEQEIQKQERLPTTTHSEMSDYLKYLAETKGLDEREVELVESVLARRQRELTKLSRGDTQASSIEITDEDLKYSGSDLDTSHILEQQINQLKAEKIENFLDKIDEKQVEESYSVKDHESYKDDAIIKYRGETHTKTSESIKSEKHDTKDVIFEEDETVFENTLSESSEVEKRVEATSSEKTHTITEKSTLDEVRLGNVDVTSKVISEDTKTSFETPTSKKIETSKSQIETTKAFLDSELQMHEETADGVSDLKGQIKSEDMCKKEFSEKSTVEHSQHSTIESHSKTVHEEIKRTSSSDSKSSDEPFSTCSSGRKGDSETSKIHQEVLLRKASSLPRAERKSGIDFEAYSSSGESHYHSFELDSGKSRPCSSDVEGLIAAGSSEYESALTSQEFSCRSHVTSTDYHTAVSSLSSKDSMKSLDSESSGHLGSVEISELSETLVPSASDLEGDMIDADQLDWNEDAEDVSDKQSKMKRSYEMTFQPEPKILTNESPQGDDSDKKFTSMDEGSILSMSLSSTSGTEPKTVIELSERMSVSGISDQLSIEGSCDSLVFQPGVTGVSTTNDISTCTEQHDTNLQIESITFTTSIVNESGIRSVSTQVISESHIPEIDRTVETAQVNGIKKKCHRRQESTSGFFSPSVLSNLHSELTESDKYLEMSFKEVINDEKKDIDESFETEADQGFHRDVREGKYQDIDDEIKDDTPELSSETQTSIGELEQEYTSVLARAQDTKKKADRSSTSSEKSSFEEAEAEAAFSMVAHVSPAHKIKQICPILEDEDAEKHELETRERAQKEYEQRRAQIRDQSPGSIPDIKVTQHMTPLVDRNFRYPDLEIEEEERQKEQEKENEAQKSTPQTPSSKSSEDTDQGREYVLEDSGISVLDESKSTVVECTIKEEDSDSPNSDSFEMLEKPDLIDDFVVIEEVAKEAQELDSEGKSVKIKPTKSRKSGKKHDEEVEAYLTSSAPTPLTRMTDVKYYPDGSSSEELGFDFEESPPVNNEASASTYDKELEANKKWMEQQFQGDHAARLAAGYDYEMDFERGPLEDIKEEDINDFDPSSRIGSLGSQKESGGSLGSVKDSYSSTPEYDVLAGRKYFTRSGEHDDVSMSSLQEFENLERAMSLETRRCHQGSQDSPSNGSFKTRYYASKSGQGDDVSVSSLKEFEGLEMACIAVHTIETKAKEEEAMLAQIDEGQESLASESESCETLSRTDKKLIPDSDEEDYEKRMFEIDEIIKQAQTNVERFIDLKEGDKTESLGRGDSIEEVAKVPDLDLDQPIARPVKVQWKNDSDPMAVSTDSIEDKLEEKTSHHDSTDSLDQKTGADLMTASTDSIEFQSRKTEPTNLMTDSIEIKDEPSGMIASDSLELSIKQVDMAESIDSLADPTSSTATHATYQYETDSVFSGSFTSGGSNTMVSSTDTIDPVQVDIAIAARKVWFDEDCSSSRMITTEFPDVGKPYVTEVIEPIDELGFSHTIHRRVELPAEVRKVTFYGSDADDKLKQFIEDFNEGEHVEEIEEIDEAGNVHIKRVVQKRVILRGDEDPSAKSLASKTNQLTSEIKGEEVLFAASGSGAQDTSKKAQSPRRRQLRYEISIDDQIEVDPREHDWRFNLPEHAESDESGGQLQGRPISDQHQLSEEMKQLLQELERESKQ